MIPTEQFFIVPKALLESLTDMTRNDIVSFLRYYNGEKLADKDIRELVQKELWDDHGPIFVEPVEIQKAKRKTADEIYQLAVCDVMSLDPDVWKIYESLAQEQTFRTHKEPTMKQRVVMLQDLHKMFNRYGLFQLKNADAIAKRAGGTKYNTHYMNGILRKDTEKHNNENLNLTSGAEW